MKLKAYKYQGAGNDFIILDNRNRSVSLGRNEIKHICHRRFGIGGDGLMLLEQSKNFSFSMRYFNSDGSEGMMCGNGGRCLTAFAAHMGLNTDAFEAIDGIHHAKIIEYSSKKCIVEISMIDVDNIKELSPKRYYLNTGSPQLVIFIEDLKGYDVIGEGRLWRNHPTFPDGTNVNFVKGNWGRDSSNWGHTLHSGAPLEISLRTYERGVEDETFACGSGSVASSIAYHKLLNRQRIIKAEELPLKVVTNVKAVGGDLSVTFNFNGGDSYTDVFLTGPATFVFECEIELENRLF